MDSRFERLVQSTPALFPLPETLRLLRRVLDDVTIDAHQLVPIVEADPGLTANVLKLCNSSMYGQRRCVGSVKEALVVLGNRTLVRLAFGTGLRRRMHSALPAYSLGPGGLWRHSLNTAYLTSQLVRARGVSQLRDRAFTAGLLHDVGKILISPLVLKKLAHFPVSVAGEALLDAERLAAGFDHAEAGGALLEAWEFPQMLVDAVRHHHAAQDGPVAAHGILTSYVHAADQISHALDRDDDAGAIEAEISRHLARLSLDIESMREALASLPEEAGDFFLMMAA